MNGKTCLARGIDILQSCKSAVLLSTTVVVEFRRKISKICQFTLSESMFCIVKACHHYSPFSNVKVLVVRSAYRTDCA